jgi:hypothetical protein
VNDKTPTDPVSPLAAAAVAQYELYRSYREAGFTMQEAIKLIVEYMTKSAGGTQ